MLMTMTTVRLDPAELTDRAQQLARLIAQRRELEQERKAFNHDMREKRERIDYQVEKLADALRTGQEDRPAQAEMPFDADGDTKEYDTMTGEVLPRGIARIHR